MASDRRVGRAAAASGESAEVGQDTSVGSAKTKDRRPALRPLLALRPYILSHRAMLVAAGVAMLVSALAMLVVPLAFRRMIDFGFTLSDGSFIDRYFAMLIAIGIVVAVASSARFFCVNWIGERVVADVRRDVFAHLARLGPRFYETTHSGEVMSRLTADTTLIRSAAGSTISQALRNLVMLAGSLTMMFITSLKLSLLLLVVIPLIVFPLMGYGRVVRRLSRVAQDSLADASAYASENLAAVRTMQAFTHEPTVIQRYSGAVERAFQAARSRNMARAGLTAITIFLVFASVAGILWIGASAVIAGEISGGRLGQFVLYAFFAAGALAELSEVWGEVQQAAGASERLMELLDEKPAIQTPAQPTPLPAPCQGRIGLKNLTFTYPAQPELAALQDVSFSVEKGQQVAIVGPSGAGKSTLFSLLLRFYDPDSGTLTIDDLNISELDVTALRKQIAYVPQEVALFADTVAENIRYGTPDATLESVYEAAKAAQAHEFIAKLPDAYDTKLGERGTTLSGGQRQRIAIARAILRDAPILLLDEATSALDAENETLVQSALERVMRDRTTLVIAHRLATVTRADRILVLDKGRIVEDGTHEELSRRGGLYERLARMQFASEAVG